MLCSRSKSESCGTASISRRGRGANAEHAHKTQAYQNIVEGTFARQIVGKLEVSVGEAIVQAGVALRCAKELTGDDKRQARDIERSTHERHLVILSVDVRTGSKGSFGNLSRV